MTERSRGWGERIQVDGGGPESAMVSAEYAGAGRNHCRYFGADRGAGAAGADVGKTAARGGGRVHHEPEVFSRDAREDCGRARGHFADGLYGGFGIRSVDAVAIRGEGVGCADREGQGV